MKRVVKEREVYIPPTEKMNLVSEYNQKFINDNNQMHKSVPESYLKSVTQDLPTGRMDDISTQKNDYKPWSASKTRMVKPAALKQEYAPPTGPFNSTSVQRADFKRHSAVARTNGRIPDNLGFANEPLGRNTTNRMTYKPHHVEQVKLVHKNDKYIAPSSPFLNTSMSTSDFPAHKHASRAQMCKPISTLFHSTLPVQSQTTHAAEFKRWTSTSAPANVKRQEANYQRPTVAMEMTSTARDYGHFDKQTRPARNARPKTKQGTNREASFADAHSNYTSDYPRHDVEPVKRVHAASERHTSATNGHFNGTSEHHANFQWHSDKAPSKQRPKDEFLLSHEKLDTTTQYNTDFSSRFSAEECPGKLLLDGKLEGMHLEDDLETGHQYVVMPPLRGSTQVR